jgi:hypothetical protein
MMINCKESAIRSSQLRERRVTGIRKLELWYHLSICRFCRTYHSQIQTLGTLSRLIGKASAGSPGVLEDASDERLSQEAKSRIKKNLTAV